jgi:hypothetical protein
MQEGYIKFIAKWQKAPPLLPERLQDLPFWRDEMRRHHLIGVYPDGIGYGNISIRAGASDAFIISGSATGHLKTLSPKFFTTVNGINIEENEVRCEGPIIASSESMSHAVIYRTCPEVGGVIHAHHAGLWERLLNKVPTTPASATYGSPEMAKAIIQLLGETNLRQSKLFVMAGHPEGIFSFGENLARAASVLFKYLNV